MITVSNQLKSWMVCISALRWKRVLAKPMYTCVRLWRWRNYMVFRNLLSSCRALLLKRVWKVVSTVCASISRVRWGIVRTKRRCMTAKIQRWCKVMPLAPWRSLWSWQLMQFAVIRIREWFIRNATSWMVLRRLSTWLLSIRLSLWTSRKIWRANCRQVRLMIWTRCAHCVIVPRILTSTIWCIGLIQLMLTERSWWKVLWWRMHSKRVVMLSHISSWLMCATRRNFKRMLKCWFATKMVRSDENRCGWIIMTSWIFVLATVFTKVIPSMKFRRFQRVWRLGRKESWCLVKIGAVTKIKLCAKWFAWLLPSILSENIYCAIKELRYWVYFLLIRWQVIWNMMLTAIWLTENLRAGLMSCTRKSEKRAVFTRRSCPKTRARYEKRTLPRCAKAAKQASSIVKRVRAMHRMSRLMTWLWKARKNCSTRQIQYGLFLATRHWKRVGTTRMCFKFVWCARAVVKMIADRRLGGVCVCQYDRMVNECLTSRSISWWWSPMNRIVILRIIYKRNIRKLVWRLVLCGVVSLHE